VAPGLEIVVDLQGAKMRLGALVERQLTAGEAVVFSSQEAEGGALLLPHPELFAQVTPGERLTADDDRLCFEVVRAGAERIEARVLTAGRLGPRKGVNVVEHPIVLEDLCAGDRAALAALKGIGGLSFAISFVADGREAEWVHRRRPGARLVAKIERREAVGCLEAIAASVDALWICRGDLGAQLGVSGLVRFVSDLDPGKVGRPVLMAGQVLEHLTGHASPTRSEVCHLGDLVRRGYAGIVLSDETAIGRDPVHAVRVAAELLRTLVD
jgi:pyruvate kinase